MRDIKNSRIPMHNQGCGKASSGQEGGGEEVLSGWCSSMELPQSHPKYQQEGNEEYKAYPIVNALYAP